MNTYYEVYSSDVTPSTYGGEAWLDEDWEMKDYGIQLGDLSISGISPKQAVTLACALVDHLSVNGHKFELKEADHQDRHIKLKYKGQL